jgi:ribonuclease D
MTEEAPQLPLLEQPRVESVELIDQLDAYDAAVSTLAAAEGPIAIDAERASGFKYSQRAYLIQIHRAGTPIYLIDPIAIQNFDPDAFVRLAHAINSSEWILHAASQDIPCLRELGLVPKSVFDTELAARIAGFERVGLGAVTEQILSIRLAKEHSAVDWSTRPLAQDWLNYAALDVDVLLELREGIRQILIEQQKLAWAEEEFAAIVSAQPKPPKQDRWRSMTGMHELREARALAIAKELWQAREELAKKLDVSPGRLIPDISIVGVAKSTPKSKPELASSKTFTGRASRTYLDTWWAAIQAGQSARDLPPIKLPNTGIPNHRTWPNRFPEADRRLKAVRAALTELAESNQLPLENLITPDFVRQICWEPPVERDAESIVLALKDLGARGWQTTLVSHVMLQAITEADQTTE